VLLRKFHAALTVEEARRALALITRTPLARAEGGTAETHRQEALALARRFGMAVRRGPPPAPFGWNGKELSGDTEPYVLLHEIAHFQLAPGERRGLIEFGHGPGPDTLDMEGAERAAVLFGVDRDREEAKASLLGILWEAALGHPALASLLDQNWLEATADGRAARHFEHVFRSLRADRLVDPAGRPTLCLR
jgi:hypothetical protein